MTEASRHRGSVRIEVPGPPETVTAGPQVRRFDGAETWTFLDEPSTIAA